MSSQTVDGRYVLEERLAVGGMAEVWAAHDTELDRRVALKLLQGSADRIRFAREARAAAGLSHPSICQLYDYGEADGRPYIVLEYLGAGTLEDRLSAGEPLPDDEAGRIAREIAAGLAHAHARGLVHRDLKPGNVLFDDEGSAKITDFGIAKIAGASTLTESGTLLGTASYMSPEQARGERASAASDVYSFGVILYRLLTGRLPFESDSALEVAAMHERAEPPPLAELRPDAPPQLERVATAALAKDPAARPRDGSALVEALGGRPEEATATLVLPAATEVVPRPEEPPPRAGRRTRALAVGAALAALAVIGASAALLAAAGDSEAPAQEPQTTRSAPPATRPATSSTTQPTQTRTGTTTTGPAPGPITQPTVPTSTTTQPPTSAPTSTTTQPQTTTAPTTTTTTDTSTAPGTTTTSPPPPPP